MSERTSAGAAKARGSAPSGGAGQQDGKRGADPARLLSLNYQNYAVQEERRKNSAKKKKPAARDLQLTTGTSVAN